MKPLSDFETLNAARTHTEVQGRMIHRNTMNAWLSQAKKYRRLKEIAADETHPLGDEASAFLDSTEYNLILTSDMGRGVIALMSALVEAEGNDPALQAVLDQGIASANREYRPYENVSEYEWRKARGEAIFKVRAAVVDGFLDVFASVDVEPHRPVVYAFIAGEYRYVTTLPEVSAAGRYSCEVPRTHSSLYVDDFYGVLE